MTNSYEQLIAPRVLDSRLKLHLVLQFLIHSQLVTTAAMLSERLRENPWAVAEALEELAEQQLLTRAMNQGKLIYRVGSNLMYRARLARLAEDFDDPHQRDRIHALVQAAHGERQFSAWLTAGEPGAGQ